MADTAGIDVSQLSGSQQEALQQYTDVTGQELNDAIPLLERSQWNVQIAIAKFFDGEGPDLLAEAQRAQQNAPRFETLHDNFDEFVVPPSVPRTEPAPRVVPQLPVLYQPPFLLSVLFTPFQFGYRVLSGVLRFVSYMFSFLPQRLFTRAVTSSIPRGWRAAGGRRPLLPAQTAERFRREFEEEYGQHGLPFFEGGHAQALDAAKRDLKFLVTVLISPEHDETDSFIRNTLLSPEVVGFINDPANNIILWAGNVLDSEALLVANEYMCNKYPFSCVACLTPKEGSTRMGIIKRLAGPITPAAYISGIQSSIAQYAPDLDGVRAERVAQAAARNLRNEQDSAYERSLALDRERARQRREAAEAQAAAEKRALEEAEAAARLAEMRQQWRKWRATTIAAEPDARTKDVVRLALTMPPSRGGDRVVRRFASQATLEEVYAFVECYDLLQSASLDEKATEPSDYEHKYTFQIASLMPRETFEPSKNTTIGEKMGRGGNLLIEDIEEDESEDEAEE